MEQFNCYESRGDSVIALLRMYFAANPSVKLSSAKVLAISTEDVPCVVDGLQTCSFMVTDKNYPRAFPCFLFDSWREIGINDYSSVCKSVSNINCPAVSNKIGWIGTPLNEPRKHMLQFGEKYSTYCDFRTIEWNRGSPQNLTVSVSNYMSVESQAKEWKYLIDIQGHGWSARTKMLLHSKRIVFIVERIYEEFWYEYLTPWVHYVPIKPDLSDLIESYERLESDPSLYQYIVEHKKAFCESYLTRDCAINQIGRCLHAHGILN